MKLQDYSLDPAIDGVVIKNLAWHYSDDGQFREVARFDEKDGFRQMNHSVLQPGACKAWHRHKYQKDLMYSFHPLLIGLKDDRLDSKTYGNIMRFVICNQSVLIPTGVLHGLKNLNNFQVDLFYLVTQTFNPEDEWREPWDLLGEDFWKMTKG